MPSLKTRTAYQLANLEMAGNAVMPDIPPVTVLADYAGAIIAGQLPRDIAAKRLDDTTDVTTLAAWTATTVSGDATYTIGAATGILNLTAITLDTVIEVTSLRNSIARSKRVLVNVVLQDPPQSSAATTSYDSSIESVNSTSYGGANAGPMTITCGAGGEIALTAPLRFHGSTGIQGCFGKWQISAAGAGIWSDVDTEIASDYDSTAGADGSITVNPDPATGLTPGDDYDLQLLLRGTSADTLYFTGTATATTS